MNWRIRRARLEAAGPADARYDDVTLSFAADGRAAANAVVLLRNGGGKSLLLHLLFKALLPRRSDGTKTAEQQRSARPVVLPGECATVALEWEHRDDPERLLVTGHSFERGDGEESRWLFEPHEGVLTLDTLPLRDGRRRRTRAGLMRALDGLSNQHPRLGFRTVAGVRAWEDELLAAGIDPAILRYQARLNRSEGGDDDELRFNSPEAFARFVLQMVLEDEPLAKLQKQVQTHADQLARREGLAREADFCRDVAGLLQELARAHGQRGESAAELARGEAAQQQLAAVLDAAIAAATERLDRLREQREPLEQHRRRLEATERDLDGEGRIVRARTERLLSDAAEQAVRAAAGAARAADAEHAAWQLVETLAALSESEGELAGLSERVEAQERGVADAREERRGAALALAGALLHAAGALDGEAEALGERLAQAEGVQDELRQEIEALGRRGGELKERRGTLEAQLDGFARATERLRADELLGDGERPSAAVERFEAEREDLIGQRHDLDGRIASLRERREQTTARRDEARAKAAESTASAAELERRRDQSLARMRGEVDGAVHDALDVASNWQPLEEPAGAELAIERARAAADARRATVANEIDARAADERALERDGLLAVESDVERICEELEAMGMRALPALRHLAETCGRDGDALAAAIAAQPGIAAGVVLLDGDPHEAIVELTAARVRAPRRPLILAAAAELDGPATARGRRAARSARAAPAAVVMPAAGAYDREAALTEHEQISARLTELRAAREQHQRLSAQLGRLGAIVAGEAEALRAALPPSGRNERRLLNAVARELSRREEQAQAARARADEQERLLRETGETLAELERRRAAVEQAERRCERALERLDAVDDLDVRALRGEFERLAARIDELTAEAEGVRRRRDETIRDGKGLEDRLATLRGEAATLRRRAAELPLDGREPVVAEGSLAALSERLLVAEQLLESRISDGELRARMAGAEARAARLRADLERAGAAVVERARALAGSTAGIDPAALARGQREAKEAYERALRDQGEAATVEGQAAERLFAANEALIPADRTREPRLLGTLTPEDPAHGAALLGELNELRAAREEEVAGNRLKLADSDERIATEEELLGELRAGRGRLAVDDARVRPATAAGAAQAGEGARGARPHVGELPAWVRRRDRIHEQVTETVRALERAVRADGESRRALQERIRALADAVAAADERIPAGITAPLRAGEALAPDAARLEGELRTRAGELDRTVGELERHRQALVAQLLAVGAEGVRKLDRVAAATTLPREEALGAWSGKQFARVRHTLVTDDAARHTQLGRVLDAAVEGNARRRGLDLAFAATMALLQDGLEVTVLKPHPQPDGQYHPIEVVGPEFSGGEELTIKLVLFCAVSAVRTAERAGRAAGRRAGPLLIDNPIGTASRESLVDLQLRLARHLDAQFIPFTGLEGELNVTGRFAAVVALTNDKDLLGGMRFVKPLGGDGAGADGPLLPPRPADAPDDAAIVTAVSYTPRIDVAALADAARNEG
jgi:DNA repair exonuclease SbcCD ATPase subunit